MARHIAATPYRESFFDTLVYKQYDTYIPKQYDLNFIADSLVVSSSIEL
jgi:hypothetical protein